MYLHGQAAASRWRHVIRLLPQHSRWKTSLDFMLVMYIQVTLRQGNIFFHLFIISAVSVRHPVICVVILCGHTDLGVTV